MTSSTESKSESGMKAGVLTVGLVGVGVMGKCILGALQKAGYRVTAWDPFPGAQAYIVEHGATLAGSPADLAAGADLIIMSLPAGKQVLEVVNGLRAALTPAHIIVDTSTVGPDTSREAAGIAGAKGARYLDAPVLGRPGGVGNWLLPTGGPAEAVEQAKPALLAFARAVIHVGGQGTGNIYKLLNQLMFSVINGISAEVMALTDALGVDRKTFFEVVANSGAATVSGLFKETAGRIAADRFDEPTFTVELLCKDAGLALRMVEQAGARSRIAGFVQEINENAKVNGLAKEDTSALYKAFRDRIRQEMNDGSTQVQGVRS